MTPGEHGSIMLIRELASSGDRHADALLADGWALFESAPHCAASRVATFHPDVVVWSRPPRERLCEIEGTPVVALVDELPLDRGRELLRSGAFDVVVESSDPDALLFAVERAARLSEVRRENERLGSELSKANQVLQSKLVELQRQTRRQAMVEDALTLARDHAMSASQAKSAFLTNMSHELRTPLNAMLGYAELMSETVADPHVIADLGRIVYAGHHLLSLIDDVLDLAKVEAGHAKLELAEIDVDAVVEAVRLQAMPSVEQRGLVFVVEHRPGPFSGFRADPRLVLQCLHQIVDNAIKFTEFGQITLAVGRVDDEIHFAVTDTGCGISPREQAAIFGAFHQLDEGARRTGPGLGLTITRRLCDLMDATLAVSSEVGVGSTFTIRLPLVGPRSTSDEGELQLLAPSGTAGG